MPYTSEKPKNASDSIDLRRRVPGWGVDLELGNRPAVPKERYNPGATGAHWTFPERQPELYARERSVEHKFLTPVFGTACPPKGLSGIIRRYAYTLSEGRAAHWMLLMLADRADVIESRVVAILRGRPDNPLAESGIKSEWTRHGVRSRWGQHRADVRRLSMEVALLTTAGVTAWAIRRQRKRHGLMRLVR